MRTIKKLSERDHVLKLPARYIGSAKEVKSERFILNETETKFVMEEVSYVPGVLKIFEEILDNSVDAYVDLGLKTGQKIDIEIAKDHFKIKDEGTGIPVVLNEDNEYYPFVAFNYLKSGGNFEGSRKSMGLHGEGAALTNYFSKKFIAESFDGKMYFKGVWTNNAGDYKEIVKSVKNTKPGVTITVYPDFERLSKTEFNDVDIRLIKTRIVMLSFIYPEITFTLNGERIKNKKVEGYVV